MRCDPLKTPRPLDHTLDGAVLGVWWVQIKQVETVLLIERRATDTDSKTLVGRFFGPLLRCIKGLIAMTYI